MAVEVNSESTRAALQLTSSAATGVYFARQTHAAGETTATAVAFEATSAAATQQATGTGTAQAATATQVMAKHFVQATATQLAVNELILSVLAADKQPSNDRLERASAIFSTQNNMTASPLSDALYRPHLVRVAGGAQQSAAG